MIEMAPVEGGLYQCGFAGDTFNTAWHLKQTLGSAAQVGFATRIGTDALSLRFREELIADGLGVDAVAQDPARSMGLYMISLQQSERSFHYWRQHSAARQLANDPAWLGAVLADADLLHLSGITLAILAPPARETLLEALATARGNGTRISFDPNLRPALWHDLGECRAAISALLPLVDIALPSFDDEARLWGDTGPEATRSRFQAEGVTEIAVKDGPGAVLWASGQDSGTTPTPRATELRDTSGAGDAFNAGYLAARLKNQNIQQAIAHGQKLAKEVLRHPGARAPLDSVPKLAP